MGRKTLVIRLEKMKAIVSKLNSPIDSWEAGEPVSMKMLLAIKEKYRRTLPGSFMEMGIQVTGKGNVLWNIYRNQPFRMQNSQLQNASSGIRYCRCPGVPRRYLCAE